ncbi:unnamed protein product, partial [Nesidiocoris tenuis]
VYKKKFIKINKPQKRVYATVSQGVDNGGRRTASGGWRTADGVRRTDKKYDTGYSSLALNGGAYDSPGGAGVRPPLTEDGHHSAPRMRGLVPILVIAGASVVFTAASAFLLYYNCTLTFY